jgi:trimethylamine--corrinoid protein Co-methyltransferase
MLAITALSDQDIANIHQASLEILSEVGLIVRSRMALEILQEGGAEVDFETTRVKLPSAMVKAALASVPARFALCSRNREPALRLGEGKTYAASGHGGIYVHDVGKNERRSATREDVANFATIADALDQVDFVAPQVFPNDVKPASSLLHAVERIFNHTTKHLYFSTESPETTRAIFEMARIVGGADDLSKHPMVSCQFSSTSPLTWQKNSIECIIEAAKAGVPCAILPGPFPGVMAPYTLMGLLTVHNAELLSGVVVAQLARKGTPLIYCCAGASFDMAAANIALASPEVALMTVACAQMARFYGMPSHCCCPETETHTLDEQHAWEKMLSLVAALNAGVDLIVNIGLMGAGLTGSFEQMVLDNEMVAVARRFHRGIDAARENIALDLIKQVGPGGDFMATDHTIARLRSGEFWQPAISNRSIHDSWVADGKRDVVQKAHARVKEILSSHTCAALDQERRRRLSAIIDDFEKTRQPERR